MLRSIRYGEADRILHVYTPHRGRVSAIAKGVRRARSRFGGRLEPFFRLRLELHEGRGELLTVTGAHTVATPIPACASMPARWTPRRGLATRWGACSRRRSRTRGSSTCSAASWRCWTKLGDRGPDPLDAIGWADANRRSGGGAAVPAEAAARRRSGAAAGALRVLRRARASRRVLGRRRGRGLRAPARRRRSRWAGRPRFMADALGRPFAETPQRRRAGARAGRARDSETLEHHAHLRLTPAAGARLSPRA